MTLMMVHQPCLHLMVDTLTCGWLVHHHSLLSLGLWNRITNSTTLKPAF